MRPVDHASTAVPLVLAIERDGVTERDCRDPRGEVDVVRDEHRRARSETKDEALVTTPVAVIGQETRHHTLACYLHMAAVVTNGDRDVGPGTALQQREENDRRDREQRNEALHALTYRTHVLVACIIA